MRQSRRILFISLLAIILAAFAWLVLESHEPSYQGKKLTEWLIEAKNSEAIFYPEANLEAVNAIRHIGTNALPILLKLEATKDTPLRRVLLNLDTRLAKRFSKPILRVQTQDELQALGGFGFLILGPDAKPAVPKLIALLKSDDENVRFASTYALGYIGPAAQGAVSALIEGFKNSRHNFPAAYALGKIGSPARISAPYLLSNVLTNGVDWERAISQAALIKMGAAPISPFIEKLKGVSDRSNWVETVQVIMNCGTNAAEAVPSLIEALKGSQAIQWPALTALGHIHQYPDISVAAIVPFLQHTNANFRDLAIDDLRKFGRAANGATPTLLRCLDDPEYKVRINATNAIREINPDVAAKLWKK